MDHAGYKVDPVELKCVAENVYFESRGEPIMDQIYVANVTMNRVKDNTGRWADTPCGVVYQPYQFSWTNDKLSIKMQENLIASSEAKKELWSQIVEVSGLVMAGLIDDQTNGANHYHRRDVKPAWRNNLQRITTLKSYSVHVFYTDKKSVNPDNKKDIASL